MFYIIKPQEHHLHQSSIHPFLKELQDSVALKRDQDLKQATFILVKEEIEGISGGVLLLKQRMTTLSPEVRKRLSSFCPHTKEIWTGMIALQMSEDITGHDFEKICKILYRALYEEIIVFSVRENISFLCLTMPLIEHLTIDMLGLWPYAVEVRPVVSSDGLFHGVLALPSLKHDPNYYWRNSINVKKPDLYSSPAPQLLCAQNCNKIDTFYKKIRPFFPL